MIRCATCTPKSPGGYIAPGSHLIPFSIVNPVLATLAITNMFPL